MASSRPRLPGALVIMAGATLAVVVAMWLTGSAFNSAWTAQQVSPPINFDLRDHDGRSTSAEDWTGQWLIVMFGFTQCPDVCPGNLFKLSEVLDQLGADAERVQALMITVDPERDSPAVLERYVTHFHPSIVGLTGTPGQIAAAADSFRAYYDDEADGSGADKGLVHSAFFYLINPDREFTAMHADSKSAEAITTDIRHQLYKHD